MDRIICRICGKQDRHPRFFPREMMFGSRRPFEYFACTACGTIQIVELPGHAAKLYPDDYYSYQRPAGIEHLVKSCIARHAYRRFDPLGWLCASLLGSNGAVQALRAAGVPRDAAVLDVGCGNGELLYWLSTLGFSNLTGVDPYAPAGVATSFPIRRCPLERVDGQFDVIILNHVFEHLAAPQASLRAVRDRLRPGGQAIVRIPVADSFARQHYGTDWVQWDAPRHLFLYTRYSLAILARQCGLAVRDVVSDSTAFQFWGSEQYRDDLPLHGPRQRHGVLRHAMKLWRYARRAAALNAQGQGDSATFFLTLAPIPAGARREHTAAPRPTRRPVVKGGSAEEELDQAN